MRFHALVSVALVGTGCITSHAWEYGTTAKMIFPVSFLVSYVSQFMTLMAGDLIITGTPAGVGMGMKPPRFLTEGDRIRLSVEGLGEQNQQVVRGE